VHDKNHGKEAYITSTFVRETHILSDNMCAGKHASIVIAPLNVDDVVINDNSVKA